MNSTVNPEGLKADARSGEANFTTWDGTRLFYRWLRPESGRGTVVVVHGITEHSGRYTWLAEALVAAGFAFYAFDHRGHGRSDGPRGHVEHFDHYVEDVNSFCNRVRQSEQGLPVFLMGHSMGSLVAARYAARGEKFLKGVILTASPAQLGLPRPQLMRILGKMLAMIRPTWGLDPGIDPCALSHDGEVIQATRTDPLILRRVTACWFVELLAAVSDLPEHARAIRMPVLVLHGTEDSIAFVAGAYQLLRWIGSEDKKLLTFPGLRHELHNEKRQDRERIFAEVVGWLWSHTETESFTEDCRDG